MVIVGSGINTDGYTFTSEAISATGVTFGAMNERQDSGTTTGQDCGLVVADFAVSSGTSSAAPVYTMTASSSGTNNPEGTSVFLRIRSSWNFVVGRVQDDKNPADAVTITTGGYTELEWSLGATGVVENGDVYQFRVTADGTPLDTYTVTPQWTISHPTAVILKDFTAVEYEGKILLQWRTGYESNNLGFHVYREEDGQLTQINPELITGAALLAGAGRATAGHAYAWWDNERSAISDQPSALKYWLEDADLTGKRTLNGPVIPEISSEPPPERAQAVLMSQLSRGQSEKDRIASRLWALQARLGKTQTSDTRHQQLILDP
jgi:hypothetical protein